jgi:hypothetical protein
VGALAAKARFGVLRGVQARDAAARYALNCFQQAQWVEAIARARSRSHEFVAVRAQCDGGTDAHLFGGEHRRFGLSVFESMPMMGYGGWVSTHALSVDFERDLTTRWLAGCAWPLVEITCAPGRVAALPAAPVGTTVLRWAGLRRFAPADTQTHLLDLSGNDAALLGRARPRMRSYLRQIDRQGYVFARAGREALDAFYHRYRRGSQQWQVAATHLYPIEFFAALCDGQYGEIWQVSRDGQALGAAVMLVGADDVLYLASGIERTEGPFSPMDALIWHVARHYRDRGFKTLNLGASEGLESVRRFKEKFGAVDVAYRRVTFCLPRVFNAWRTRAGEQ